MRWVMLLLFIYALFLPNSSDPGVTFLDIGVGDATIVRFEEKVVLIDAGPSDSILYSVDGLTQDIDLLVITHQHEDHISGARYLLERFNVKEVMMPRLCNLDPFFTLFPSGADLRSTAITLLDNNDLIEYEYHLGEHEANELVKLRFFLPRYSEYSTDECVDATDSHEINDNSIITQILSSNVNILLMGDTEKEGEFELLNKPDVLYTKAGYKILKAGHHCSSTSSSEKFLRYVDPEIMICSTGVNNSYGHPNKEVLDRAKSLGIKLHVSYSDGDLFIPF